MHSNPIYPISPDSSIFQASQSDKPKAAVFWDAENVSGITEPYVANNFDNWLSSKYEVNARFAFADWSGPFKEVGTALYKIRFDLVHIPDNLKDSVDCQMAAYIIDWLLRSPQTISYIIVSGDAVFEPIVKALQKQGKQVTVVSDILVTRPETVIRADSYEDIDVFKPKAITIGALKGEKEPKRTEDELKQNAILRLQETIARLKNEGKRTYERYVKIMARRYNADISFGRPGFYDWNEVVVQAIFDGIIIVEGEGLGAQLRLSEKAAETSVDRSASLESALGKLGEIVESMYEKDERTGMEFVVNRIRAAKIDYQKLGFSKFGDFVRAAEGRNLVRIEAHEDSPPIVKPVYNEERMNKWYKDNYAKYFGEGAKIPQPRFVLRTVQFLYQYDVSFTKLESYLKNNDIQKSYDAILETSGVSFIPPYEKVILSILLGLGQNCQKALEIVNKEMAPLGYELKCP